MLFLGWMRSWVFLCLLCWVVVPNISSWWALQELIGVDAGAANSLLPVTLSLQNTKACSLANQLCASLILQEATKREKTWRPKARSLSYIPALPLAGSRVLTPLCHTGTFSSSYLLSFFFSSFHMREDMIVVCICLIFLTTVSSCNHFPANNMISFIIDLNNTRVSKNVCVHVYVCVHICVFSLYSLSVNGYLGKFHILIIVRYGKASTGLWICVLT